MKSTLFPLSIPLILVLFSLNSSFMATPGWTLETSEYTNPASIMSFADNFFHHGHYYRAVMEYERFIYFYPKHPDTPKARLKIALSMKSSKDYASALKLFTLLAEEHKDTPPGTEASFQKAEILYLIHDYQSALKQYEEFISRYPQHQLADKAKSAIEKIEKQSPLRSQRTQR